MTDGPPKILVVDDNRLVRELVRDTFTEAGFAVATAASGREALEEVALVRPDLVTTDVVMPDLDGWGLCEAIKANPATHEIAVVFLSSQRDVPDRVRGLRLGADDFICKPFSTEELLVRVRAILERRARPAGAPPVVALSGPRSILSGHTSHLPTPDLVQILAINGKTGRLTLKGHDVGHIHLRDGKIVGASTPTTRGRKALYRMLGWTNTNFEFDPTDDGEVEDEIGLASQRLLMDALVATDDLERIRQSLPSERAQLGLAEGATALFAVANELSMIEREVLRAAAECSTLHEILESGEGTDLEIARAVARLLEKNAIAPLV